MLDKRKIRPVRPQVTLRCDHDIQRGNFVLPQPEEIPQNTFDAVALDGVAAFF